MTIVRATDNHGWVFTYRLMRASMKEIKAVSPNGYISPSSAYDPYRLKKGQLQYALSLSKGNGKAPVVYYINQDTIDDWLSVNSDGSIQIGCMSFVGKEAAKLRKWAKG